MLKNLFNSFSLAFENIRSHFFHTLLSIVGIVIGVTALVAILSLIDGMQKYAFEQINQQRSIKSVVVRSERYKMIDNVWVKQDSVPYLTYADFLQLKSALTLPASSYFSINQSGEIRAKENNVKTGAFVIGAAASFPEYMKLAHGQLFTENDVNMANPVVVINHYLASKLAQNTPLQNLLGKSIVYQNKELKITGILQQDNNEQASRIAIPITLISAKDLDDNPPQCIVEADKIENVTVLQSQVKAWVKKVHPAKWSAFLVETDEGRLKQIARDFLLFRIIMTMIVGISIVVGGIGVMNVLLISVTERTFEIGLRKAVGAKRKDIMLLFLSESITISALGSGLGLIFGILSTFAIVPIIKAIMNLPVAFEASYTWNTLMIIASIAVLVGIIFGTYPALRASRLSPVDAIRRE